MCAGFEVGEGFEGIDRVRGAAALDLQRAAAKCGIVGDRSLHHRQAVRAGCEPALGLVRRLIRGEEIDALERERLAHLFGAAQVAEMDRVEGPAEDSDSGAHGDYSRTWPEP